MYSHNASRRTQTTLAVGAHAVNALIKIIGWVTHLRRDPVAKLRHFVEKAARDTRRS